MNVESGALDQGGGPGVLFNAMAGRAAEALGAVIIYHWANEVPPVAAQLALGATKGWLLTDRLMHLKPNLGIRPSRAWQ